MMRDMTRDTTGRWTGWQRVVRPVVGAIASATLAMTSLLPTTALAGVPRMPNVTEEMSSATHWSQKAKDPDFVLATPDEIAQTNRDCLDASASTCMNDIENWPETEYDGVAYGTALAAAATEDARYFCSMAARFYTDGSGNTSFLSTDDAMALLYGPMIENTNNLQATENEPVRYGVGVNRTCVLSFPSTAPLWDDATDPDFDYQYQTMLRVNEPFIVKGTSNDGRFSHIITSCTQGWVSNDDIAICADKDEWLSAWKTDEAGSDVLVIYDDKVRTETSYYAPEMSNRLLPMGTCLKLAAEEDWGNIRQDINRSGHNCHVVWMPNRDENGFYEPKLALVSEVKKASEGYLPLTYSNIAAVAMNQLGDCYGWGGMLDSDDCSGYVRDVYRCFGYDLPRNTTWQEAMPVTTYRLGGLPKDGGLSADEKKEIISQLPLGSILIFNGHEMLYLGSEGDDLYVISSISNAFVEGTKVRVRGCVINTLDDITRTDGNTWLDHLTSAKVPFPEPFYLDEGPIYPAIGGDGATWARGDGPLQVSFGREPDDGDCLAHFRSLQIDWYDVDASLYEATSGSTVITLSTALLESLDAGEHVLTAIFDDGSGIAQFSVTVPETFVVNVAAFEHGKLEADATEATEGTFVGVSATPDDGYETAWVNVVGDRSGSEVSITEKDGKKGFSMPAENVTVSAAFAKKQQGSSDGRRGGNDAMDGDGKSGDSTDGSKGASGSQRPASGAVTLPTSASAGTAAIPLAKASSGAGSLPTTDDPTNPTGAAMAAVAGTCLIAAGSACRRRKDA